MGWKRAVLCYTASSYDVVLCMYILFLAHGFGGRTTVPVRSIYTMRPTSFEIIALLSEQPMFRYICDVSMCAISAEIQLGECTPPPLNLALP